MLWINPVAWWWYYKLCCHLVNAQGARLTFILIRRNETTDICHDITDLIPYCTNTPFSFMHHCSGLQRNSNNLHNVISSMDFIYLVLARQPFLELFTEWLQPSLALCRDTFVSTHNARRMPWKLCSMLWRTFPNVTGCVDCTHVKIATRPLTSTNTSTGNITTR